MSREAAGAAIRALRESRDWSLADLASATGVSIMGLSYLERGARKPHKGTVQKVENGLGLPPGTYFRLVLADDPSAELAQLLSTAEPPLQPGRRPSTPVVVQRRQDTDVLEAHAEAHLESLNSLITRLPAETSNEYESYIASVIAQCVKAELLAANSWRVAVNGSGESVHRLMAHLKALENIRAGLLARLPGSISAKFDQACRQSRLPEAVVAAMLGMSVDEVWMMRNSGVVPPGSLARVRAFVDGELC